LDSVFYQSEALKEMLEKEDEIIDKITLKNKFEKIKSIEIFKEEEEEEKKTNLNLNEFRNSFSQKHEKVIEDPKENQILLKCLNAHNKKRFLMTKSEKELDRKINLKEKEFKVVLYKL